VASHFLHVFWCTVEHMANTVIFVLAGAIIAFDVFLLRIDVLTGRDWGLLFASCLRLLVIRLLMLLLCSPRIPPYGYRRTARDCSPSKFTSPHVSGIDRLVKSLDWSILSTGQTSLPRATALPRRDISGIASAPTLLVNGPGATEHAIAALGLGPKGDPEEARLSTTGSAAAAGRGDGRRPPRGRGGRGQGAEAALRAAAGRRRRPAVIRASTIFTD
jgi:hypothetical protein